MTVRIAIRHKAEHFAGHPRDCLREFQLEIAEPGATVRIYEDFRRELPAGEIGEVYLRVEGVPDFFEACYAAQRLGAYCVPVDWHGKTPEIGYVLRDCGATEARVGRTEGRKDRPCVIVAAIKRAADGRFRVRVLPITHSPTGEARSIAIPPKVKRHLGLDADASWIVLD
jgi:hypothetical protein